MSSNMLATSSRGTSLPSRIASILLGDVPCQNRWFADVRAGRVHEADAERGPRRQVADGLDRAGPERQVTAEEHLADRRPLPVDLDPAAVFAVTCRLGKPIGDHRQLALVGRIDNAAP